MFSELQHPGRQVWDQLGQGCLLVLCCSSSNVEVRYFPLLGEVNVFVGICLPVLWVVLVASCLLQSGPVDMSSWINQS